MKTIAKCTVRYGAFRVRVVILLNNGLYSVPVRRGYPRLSGRRDWGGEHTFDEALSVVGITDEAAARRRFVHSVACISTNYVFPARSA